MFLRDLLTIHPFLHYLSFIISLSLILSLSLSVSLFISLSFRGAYRCFILCMKNSLQILIAEYLMPFNFSLALKVTLPSLPFISSIFSPHSRSTCIVSAAAFSPWKHPVLSLRNKPSLAFLLRNNTTKWQNTSSHMLLQMNRINKTFYEFERIVCFIVAFVTSTVVI